MGYNRSAFGFAHIPKKKKKKRKMRSVFRRKDPCLPNDYLVVSREYPVTDYFVYTRVYPWQATLYRELKVKVKIFG